MHSCRKWWTPWPSLCNDPDSCFDQFNGQDPAMSLDQNDSNRPAVSVIIPCRNEEQHIEACLRSVLAQEPPEGDFEILVVEGRSDDRTRELIERMCRTEPRLRLLDNPARITPAAFNTGIRAARGDLIAIMGAHNTYASDYLLQAQRVSQETGAENVGGAMECLGQGFLQQVIAASHHCSFAVGGAAWHQTDYEGPADTVFGGIYRREVFDRIGLFDETLVRNQDDELNLRLSRSGGVIWHSPRIRSSYSPRDSLGKLLRQYYQYGYWKVAVIRKHRLPASIRHLVPALFVMLLAGSILMSLILALFSMTQAALLFLGLAAAALLLWLLSALFFSFKIALGKGFAYLFVLPVVFACYHFGYGAGFLVALGGGGRKREGATVSAINR